MSISTHPTCCVTPRRSPSTSSFSKLVRVVDHTSLTTFSGEQKGLFTAGIMGFVFAPLQLYSKRADEIHKAAIEKIEANKDKYPPGLYEQYQIQIERLKEGAPGCEVVNVPGFLSFPNPPKPGKKYFSLLPAMNHQFSRGWTVSATPSRRKLVSHYVSRR